jgi:hypothetical protein
MRALTKVIIVAVTVVLVISGVSLLFTNFLPAQYNYRPSDKTYPQVYIRSSGAIESNNANLSAVPISCSGNLYTFNSDMELQKLVVEKSNIILDGNRHSVRIVGPGSYKNGWNLGRLDVLGANNVTLRNLRFADTQLTFTDSSNCTAVDNNFISVHMENCRDIFVSKDNYPYGCSVELRDTNNCTVSNSTINFFSLTNSYYNSLLHNNMTMVKRLALQFVDSGSNLFFGNSIERSIQLCKITGTSGDNLFVGNFIRGTFNYDPVITCSGVNTFYHNNLINFYWNTAIPCSHNLWDNGVEGNYWNDYHSPHRIDANNLDRYPLTRPVDLSLEPQPQI